MLLAEPFNADEREAQSLGGGGPLVAPIRDSMPDQHRLFFAGLHYIVVATADPEGWPEATLLTGAPGFVASPDPATLVVSASAPNIRPGQAAGLLGIDFATRRRNRANGTVTAATPTGFTVLVKESFGNCPKYIQRRAVFPANREAGPMEHLSALDDAARHLVTGADTVFVASRARAGLGGVDVSHRGGRSGFVRIEGNRLIVPDLPGNRYFNTLGNLLGDSRAALLFADFERGDLLHLQGHATIEWAEYRWVLDVDRGWRQRAAVPLRWSAPEFSPFLDQEGHQA